MAIQCTVGMLTLAGSRWLGHTFAAEYAVDTNASARGGGAVLSPQAISHLRQKRIMRDLCNVGYLHSVAAQLSSGCAYADKAMTSFPRPCRHGYLGCDLIAGVYDSVNR